MDLLKSLEIVCSAGGPIPNELGEKLLAENVHLMSAIASSESGIIMNTVRDSENVKAWDYFRRLPHVAVPSLGESRGGTLRARAGCTFPYGQYS